MLRDKRERKRKERIPKVSIIMYHACIMRLFCFFFFFFFFFLSLPVLLLTYISFHYTYFETVWFNANYMIPINEEPEEEEAEEETGIAFLFLLRKEENKRKKIEKNRRKRLI